MAESWSVTCVDGALKFVNATTGEMRERIRASAYPLNALLSVCGVTLNACWSYRCVQVSTTSGGSSVAVVKAWVSSPAGPEPEVAGWLSADDVRLGIGATADVQ